RRGSSAPTSNRCSAGWSRSIAAGRFERASAWSNPGAGRGPERAPVTAPAVHLWRLLRWGRILARHGALRGIERDPNTPAPVRRLTRIARFGARVPDVPTYADAFQDIGPAAIKLGQALATR